MRLELQPDIFKGRLRDEWGVSDHNRKAKFYEITKLGTKHLASETAYWQRLADVMGRVLSTAGKDAQ